MEITILKRNVDVVKSIPINDEFNFEIKKIKFIDTNIKELIVNDLLTYCYPIVSYIKYESVKEIASRNLINIKPSEKTKKEDIEFMENKYTTSNDLNAFDVDMKMIRIPKNTTIQIKSFVLFNDFSKHQTFDRSNKDKIKDLFIKGEFEKIRNYINDNSYIISNDTLILKEQIKSNYDMFNSMLDYISEIFKFKVTGHPDNKGNTSDMPAIQVDSLFTKNDKNKMYYFIDSFYFNLIINNKIEAYYSHLLNLSNKTNDLLDNAKRIELEKQKKRDIDVLLETKMLDEILLNNFANKKFKKSFIQLNSKEKVIINNDYEIYKKQYSKFTNNKCEHKKLLKSLNSATMEEEVKLFHKINALADSKSKKDSMIVCNLCGYDLICPHKIELNKLRKNNSSDKVIREVIMKHYCQDSTIDKNYYCKICNENILSAESDEDSVFSRINQSQYTNEVNELNQIIYVDASFIIKNYVTFSKIINVTNFIRNIVDICGDKIADISNKLHKNKTTTQQSSYSIVKIHIYCYIIATIMFIIVSNPSDIEISLVIKKEKVKINKDELNLVDLNNESNETAVKNESIDKLIQSEEPFIISEEKNLLTPVHISDAKYINSTIEGGSSKDEPFTLPIIFLDEQYKNDSSKNEPYKNEPFTLPIVLSSDKTSSDKVSLDNTSSDKVSLDKVSLDKTSENADKKYTEGGAPSSSSQKLKYLFDTGYNIAIKVCNSYLSDANINFNDIKEILSSGFIFIKNNTGGINVKKISKLSDNISSNYNFIMLQKIHQYYGSFGDYKELLQFDKLKKELPNASSIKKDDDLIEKLYKNKINIFKHALIPNKLMKSQDTSFDKACYNLIIMLQSNKNPDLTDELQKEQSKVLDYGKLIRFINSNSDGDNKFIYANEYYPKRKFNTVVLDNGENINIEQLNKLLKDNKTVNVKDIIDNEGISFFQNKLESYDDNDENIKTKLFEINNNDIKIIPQLESMNNNKINFKGFDNLNKISKLFSKNYNVLLNLGLTEKLEYEEIVKGVVNPSSNELLSNKTRLFKLHNYFTSVISNYNQLKYNISYKNMLVTELINIYGKENNIAELSNLPDIVKFYDKSYLDLLASSNNTVLACQELLDYLFKLLFEIQNSNIPILKTFVEKILNYILKSDEIISKENYYEMIKKNDNVIDNGIVNVDETADSDAENNDLELDSNNGEDGDDEERKKKEEADEDKLDFSNDGFDYKNDESDDDSDDDENLN